jgi:hypothetical protein
MAGTYVRAPRSGSRPAGSSGSIPEEVARGAGRGKTGQSNWWTHGIPVEAETWRQIEEIAA